MYYALELNGFPRRKLYHFDTIESRRSFVKSREHMMIVGKREARLLLDTGAVHSLHPDIFLPEDNDASE